MNQMPSILRTAGDLPVQRTEKGLQYERYLKHIVGYGNARKGSKAYELWMRANEAVVAQKSTPGEVHVDAVMTNLSVQYANDEFIGLRILPIISTGGKLSQVYFKYPKRERFAYPDDSMAGHRATANELNQTRTTDSVALTPRALREFVDETTIRNQDAPLNELIDAQQNVLEGMHFLQEKRIAALVQAQASYPAGNRVQLSGTDQWSDAASTPITDILNATASVFRGRGPARLIGWTSIEVWNVLRQHADILDLFKFNGNSPGLATPDMLASWFDLDELIIGRAREDTANIGQTETYGRIWGKHFGVARVATAPSIRNASLGFTFQDRAGAETDTVFESATGMDGGWWSRSKFADAQKIVAADTSFLIEDAVA